MLGCFVTAPRVEERLDYLLEIAKSGLLAA